MKFTIVALLVACPVFTYEVAKQQQLFPFQTLAAKSQPDFRDLLERFGLWMRPVVSPTAPGSAALRRVVPQLSKAQTLRLIAGSAAKYKVPKAFVTSIVAAESNFDCAAISPKGAIGLMQLMPETAEEFGADPSVPAENIDAGTHYLRRLMDRYRRGRHGMRRVIAAYNAGPGMVDRYRGVPPFRETRLYVARVLGYLRQFAATRRRNGTNG